MWISPVLTAGSLISYRDGSTKTTSKSFSRYPLTRARGFVPGSENRRGNAEVFHDPCITHSGASKKSTLSDQPGIICQASALGVFVGMQTGSK